MKSRLNKILCSLLVVIIVLCQMNFMVYASYDKKIIPDFNLYGRHWMHDEFWYQIDNYKWSNLCSDVGKLPDARSKDFNSQGIETDMYDWYFFVRGTITDYIFEYYAVDKGDKVTMLVSDTTNYELGTNWVVTNSNFRKHITYQIVNDDYWSGSSDPAISKEYSTEDDTYQYIGGKTSGWYLLCTNMLLYTGENVKNETGLKDFLDNIDDKEAINMPEEPEVGGMAKYKFRDCNCSVIYDVTASGQIVDKFFWQYSFEDDLFGGHPEYFYVSVKYNITVFYKLKNGAFKEFVLSSPYYRYYLDKFGGGFSQYTYDISLKTSGQSREYEFNEWMQKNAIGLLDILLDSLRAYSGSDADSVLRVESKVLTANITLGKDKQGLSPDVRLFKWEGDEAIGNGEDISPKIEKEIVPDGEDGEKLGGYSYTDDNGRVIVNVNIDNSNGGNGGNGGGSVSTQPNYDTSEEPTTEDPEFNDIYKSTYKQIKDGHKGLLKMSRLATEFIPEDIWNIITNMVKIFCSCLLLFLGVALIRYLGK